MKPYWMPIFGVAALMLAGCNKTRESITTKVDELLASTEEEEAEEIPPTPPKHTTRLTDRSYEAFIGQRGALVVVVFSADWCGPCRKLGPVLDKVAGEFGDRVKLGRVDVDHSRATANLAGVNGIPDVRLFRDGRDVARFTGARPEEEVRKLVREHLPEPAATDGASGPDEPPPAGDAPPAMRPMDKNWLPPGMQKS